VGKSVDKFRDISMTDRHKITLYYNFYDISPAFGGGVRTGI